VIHILRTSGNRLNLHVQDLSPPDPKISICAQNVRRNGSFDLIFFLWILHNHIKPIETLTLCTSKAISKGSQSSLAPPSPEDASRECPIRGSRYCRYIYRPLSFYLEILSIFSKVTTIFIICFIDWKDPIRVGDPKK
jgi:hypothetical protein